MGIKCPYCELEIAADDINSSTMIAKCTFCDSVFSFAGQHGDGREPDSLKVDELFSNLEPEHISIKVSGDQLLLRFRWHRSIVALLISLFWMGFTIFGFAVGLSNADANSRAELVFISLLPLAFNISFAYVSIAGWLNSTIISVNQDQLSVVHTPVPWRSPSPVESSRIHQIDCVFKQGRKGSGSYTVTAITDWEQVKLLRGLSFDYAMYIKQAIETHLGITND